MINLTLKLFNCVPAKEGTQAKLYIQHGLILDQNAVWADKQIQEYYQSNLLKGEDLNKTFHKSWLKILDSTREDLLVEQLKHYFSTYGSDFQEEIYIPEEVLNLQGTKLKFKTIKGYSKEVITTKCLGILGNGLALEQETIEDVLALLSLLGHTFESLKGINNKEASIIISDKYGIYPEDNISALRYCVYKSTGESLLIKSEDTINAIKSSTFDPSVVFNSVGLIEMSKIFNRFKPLFLSYKKVCPSVINKIARLSKKHHEPLVSNPLNLVTSIKLQESDTHWLENASVFALFKSLNACYTRIHGQVDFVYRVRNGKSWTKQGKNLSESNKKLLGSNFNFILKHLKNTINLKGKEFFIPKYVSYALPTSEKMFVGNIPTGTKFIGEKLAVGIYWENSWGATDLDLSGVNLSGKIGWNATYNQEDSLLYSGDMTNAPNGAVEYLHCSGENIPPTLVQNNVYNGDSDCSYKIVVGHGDEVTKEYMMNPEKVLCEVKCKSVQNQMCLGLLKSEGGNNTFTLLNFASGNVRIGGESELSTISCNALVSQYDNQYNLNNLIEYLGGKVVDSMTENSYNLSTDCLEKDTLISIFS